MLTVALTVALTLVDTEALADGLEVRLTDAEAAAADRDGLPIAVTRSFSYSPSKTRPPITVKTIQLLSAVCHHDQRRRRSTVAPATCAATDISKAHTVTATSRRPGPPSRQNDSLKRFMQALLL